MKIYPYETLHNVFAHILPYFLQPRVAVQLDGHWTVLLCWGLVGLPIEDIFSLEDFLFRNCCQLLVMLLFRFTDYLIENKSKLNLVIFIYAVFMNKLTFIIH